MIYISYMHTSWYYLCTILQ